MTFLEEGQASRLFVSKTPGNDVTTIRSYWSVGR